MDKIATMEKIVFEVLQESPLSRKDDYILFWRVCEKLNKDVLDIPLGDVLLEHKGYNLPNMKSVFRYRRKIQKLHPELKSIDAVALRKQEEEQYLEYARN